MQAEPQIRAPLRRPDGVELHREVRGEGPLVVVAPHFWAFPAVYAGLVSDLSRDRRVLTYDPRGAGRSTRQGPYDEATDVADLAALIEDEGPGATIAGFGDGAMRGIVLARQRPHLVRAVVSVGAAMMAWDLADADGLAGSEVTMKMMLELLRRDHRAALRGMVRSFNSQMGENEVRRRVEEIVAYTSQEAIVARGAFLERGIASGEIRPDLDIDIAIDMILATIIGRYLAGIPLEPDWTDKVIDTIWRMIAA